MFVPSLGGMHIDGPSGSRTLQYNVQDDLDDLSTHGLIRIRRRGNHGDFDFTITPEAYDFLEAQAMIEPLVRVEQEIISQYISGDAFRERYSAAYQRWSEAAALLWGRDAEAELTTIGHKTREAVQEFATALIERDQLTDVDSNPAHTAARLRTVVDHHRVRLGEARSKVLDALIVYWGEVNDLLQRQEHGGQKEGEPLAWEDGRRVVFQTAVVMHEIDRTLY